MGIDRLIDGFDIHDELDRVTVDQIDDGPQLEQMNELDIVAGSNTFYPDATELDGYPSTVDTTADRLSRMGLSGYLKVFRPEES